MLVGLLVMVGLERRAWKLKLPILEFQGQVWKNGNVFVQKWVLIVKIDPKIYKMAHVLKF